jgi:hypothetical protein
VLIDASGSGESVAASVRRAVLDRLKVLRLAGIH